MRYRPDLRYPCGIMQRDTEEFIELLTGTQSAVFGYIMTLCHDPSLAKDILQETSVTLWRKAEDFELGTNFTAWACRTAYYHVLNHRRKMSREQLVFDEDVFDYLAERQEARSTGTDHRLELLRDCISVLPESQRDLVERRYHSGATVQAIAAQEGKSEGAISQSLFRIRAVLQRCVERKVTQEGMA